jgi:hypothetical protein
VGGRSRSTRDTIRNHEEVQAVAGFGAFDRDSGLRRVSRVTKWLVAGSVAGIGIVTAVVAEAAPGSSRTTTPPPTSPITSGPVTNSPVTDSPATSPDTTPVTSPATPPPSARTTPTTLPPITDPPLPPVRHHHVSSGGS